MEKFSKRHRAQYPSREYALKRAVANKPQNQRLDKPLTRWFSFIYESLVKLVIANNSSDLC